jgi:SAM-dependent methyltransferase
MARLQSTLRHAGSILDFGCGAGRNLKYLIDQYEVVYGYDYPNMYKFIPNSIHAAKNLLLLNDLDNVLLRNYDEILFSLVLQHIHIDELHEILKELSLHSRRFIIHSRTWIDFTEDEILPILEQYFKVDTIEYIKDHNSDKEDHFIGVFYQRVNMPRHFSRQMMSPHFHTMHADAPRPDLDLEAKIEGFFKRIICTLTFHKFFNS